MPTLYVDTNSLIPVSKTIFAVLMSITRKIFSLRQNILAEMTTEGSLTYLEQAQQATCLYLT